MIMAQVKASVLAAAVRDVLPTAAQPANCGHAPSEATRNAAATAAAGLLYSGGPSALGAAPAGSDADAAQPAGGAGSNSAAGASGQNLDVTALGCQQAGALHVLPGTLLHLAMGWLLNRLLTVVFESGPRSGGAPAAWFLAAALLGRAALEVQGAQDTATGSVSGRAVAESRTGAASYLACSSGEGQGNAAANPDRTVDCDVGAAAGSHSVPGRQSQGEGVLGGGTRRKDAAVQPGSIRESLGRLLVLLKRMQRLQVGEACAEFALLCGTNALALLAGLAEGLGYGGEGDRVHDLYDAAEALQSWRDGLQARIAV